MPVLDTEALFGMRARDKHHDAMHHRLTTLARKGSKQYAADTAVLEFQLVLRSLNRPPTAIRRALLALRAKLESYGIAEARTLGLDTLVLQAEFEEKYALSYFDSLIAASAKALDSAVISDDKAFDRVPGLTRIPLT